MGRERGKNTTSGPLFINRYVPATGAGASTATSAGAHMWRPEDSGITNARFALIQVVEASKDLVVEIGVSGSVSNPTDGSLRVGRTYGMPFLQLPPDAEIKVSPDGQSPTSDANVNYTLIFVD